MKTWKEDEKTYKSTRLNEGLGLTTSILSNIKDKLTTVADSNGWQSFMEGSVSEGGIKFVLYPRDAKNQESFTSHKEMIDLIKEGFSNFTEDQFKVEFTPHVRWMIPIITVIFN